MIDIKPGPELDRAVAEAVDPWCTVDMCDASGCRDAASDANGDVLAVWKWNGERNWTLLPKFSTDLNAAFEAAVLATDGKFAIESRSGHAVTFVVHMPKNVITCETTPALAVCAAILKLKESQ